MIDINGTGPIALITGLLILCAAWYYLVVLLSTTSDLKRVLESGEHSSLSNGWLVRRLLNGAEVRIYRVGDNFHVNLYLAFWWANLTTVIDNYPHAVTTGERTILTLRAILNKMREANSDRSPIWQDQVTPLEIR